MQTTTSTKHKVDCKRAFKNYDKSCARCMELLAGAASRPSWSSNRQQNDAQRIREIREHDCKTSNCGPVCTFGDW